ncbi:MAG: PaaI family thioesterase [Acetobacteraceae bacterium]
MQDQNASLGEWRARVEANFASQGAVRLLGARLERVDRAEVDALLPFRPELGQHLGFFHGGIIATMLDVACGMAALTRMDPGHEVLTAEFKLNYLAPARDGTLLAQGRVIRAGRVLTVCTGEAWIDGRQVALMQATMTAVRNR